MALRRRMLEALGLESDKVDEIINAHTETVNGIKDELDAEKAKNQELERKVQSIPDLEKKIKELEAEAKKSEGEGKDYEALKKEFEDYKAEQERLAIRSKKEAAYTELLKDAGIPEKHYAKILKYSDVDGVELDEKGKITTAKELLKSIREEWGDHVEKTETTGAQTDTPPAGTSGASGKTREEIMAIKDRAERQKAISENHQLFGY